MIAVPLAGECISLFYQLHSAFTCLLSILEAICYPLSLICIPSSIRASLIAQPRVSVPVFLQNLVNTSIPGLAKCFVIIILCVYIQRSNLQNLFLQSDNKVIIHINNELSKNCINNRGLDIFAVEVAPKSTMVIPCFLIKAFYQFEIITINAVNKCINMKESKIISSMIFVLVPYCTKRQETASNPFLFGSVIMGCSLNLSVPSL